MQAKAGETNAAQAEAAQGKTTRAVQKEKGHAKKEKQANAPRMAAQTNGAAPQKNPAGGTKENILQTALTLFAQKGYEAVSVQDIAGALSLTKAALYKHYPGKQAVFDALLRRMEEEDTRRAAAYNVPAVPLQQDAEAYRHATLQNMVAFAKAQLCYWTQDAFASRFRRMLALEQYRSAEMGALYQQLLCTGPLRYTQDVFAQLLHDAQAAQRAALALYAPMFLLYNVQDAQQTGEDACRIFSDYCSWFIKAFEGGVYDGKI